MNGTCEPKKGAGKLSGRFAAGKTNVRSNPSPASSKQQLKSNLPKK